MFNRCFSVRRRVSSTEPSLIARMFFRLSVLGMFIVNEQIATSIGETPSIIKSALKDTEFFLKSSNHELKAEIFEHFDRTREKIKIDLEGNDVCRTRVAQVLKFHKSLIFVTDVDKLLGERITREVSIQTGLDLTFESTAELLESKFITRTRFIDNCANFQTPEPSLSGFNT